MSPFIQNHKQHKRLRSIGQGRLRLKLSPMDQAIPNIHLDVAWHCARHECEWRTGHKRRIVYSISSKPPHCLPLQSTAEVMEGNSRHHCGKKENPENVVSYQALDFYFIFDTPAKSFCHSKPEINTITHFYHPVAKRARKPDEPLQLWQIWQQKCTCIWKAGPSGVCWGRQRCWGNLLLHTHTSRWWGKARLRETKPTKAVWLIWAGSSRSHRSSVKQPREAWRKAEDDGVELSYARRVCALVNKREQSRNEGVCYLGGWGAGRKANNLGASLCQVNLRNMNHCISCFKKLAKWKEKWSWVKKGTKGTRTLKRGDQQSQKNHYHLL